MIGQETPQSAASTKGDNVMYQGKEEVKRVKEALENLRRICIDISLTERYRELTRPLDDEVSSLVAETEEIKNWQEQRQPQIEAKIELLKREALEALAAGDTEKNQEKNAEIRETQRIIQDQVDRLSFINARGIEAIPAEKKRIAARVFSQMYADTPKATFAVIEAVVDLLDGIWDGILEFQALTRTEGDLPSQQPLVRQFHRNALLPTDLPKGGRALSLRVDRWFASKR